MWDRDDTESDGATHDMRCNAEVGVEVRQRWGASLVQCRKGDLFNLPFMASAAAHRSSRAFV